MPSKTERILSYLPGTFRAAPQNSALQAFINAYGSELQQGENKLAEVMQSHWVDFADRGAEWVNDLALIAALYGLAPRPDESVEEFRLHLKRYVRTFLEGTITVQGALRIAAEALGLIIADDYADMDTWWKRSSDELVSIDFNAADAAELVFGVKSLDVTGVAARPAEIHGTPDLSAGVDLSHLSKLYLVIDSGAPITVDLAEGAPNTHAVTLEYICERINTAAGPHLARASLNKLNLASPTLGAGSRLEVREGPGDAATLTMGLLPLNYHGTDAQRAAITGAVDLSAGVDLSEARFLRLLVDGATLAEIDCASIDPAHTFLDHIREAINTALGLEVANHDGRFLTLASPTLGGNSTIAFQRPAAQDAAVRLFGPVAPLYVGQDAQPAIVRGSVDLSAGVDLSRQPLLRIRVDDAPAVTVNCAGAIPASTSLDEVIAAINGGVAAEIASRDGRKLRLTSPSTGELSEIAIDPLPGDAAPLLLGIPPRLAEGAPATVARLAGSVNLTAGANLSARNLLDMALDGGQFVRIDLRAGAEDRQAVSLSDLVKTLNRALGADVATDDGERLIVRSLQPGGGSRLQIRPLRQEIRRRFVTRAYVAGEASKAVFGFNTAATSGVDATRASLTGQPDLSRGVDLRSARYLRLLLDDQPAVEIDCSGPRPRATLIEEAAARINQATGLTLATHDGKRLTLTSITAGAASKIAFEPPQSEDALPVLLNLPAGLVRGQNASGVSLLGVPDLSAGVDLPAGAALKIGLDGAAAQEILLASPDLGSETVHKSLSELIIAINLALGTNAARHDGKRIALISPRMGAASQLVFELPAGPDATSAIFGFAAPRAYRGSDAKPARISGSVNLSATVDLSLRRYLSIAIDGGEIVEVDCAARATDPAHTALPDIVDAINVAFQANVASSDGKYLSLNSIQTGLSGRVSVAGPTRGDARPLLFGNVPDSTFGKAPAPAVITGEVDLLPTANLSQRSLLRIAVDGGAPLDIDISGAAAEKTALLEMVAAINTAFPGLATATQDSHLRLTSPTLGSRSRLEVLPLRYLELVEYPPVTATQPDRKVKHGERWTVENPGAGREYIRADINAPQGIAGPALVNFSRGWAVRLMLSLRPAESVQVWRSQDGGLQAQVTGADGATWQVPAAQIRSGPLGAQALVPLTEPWPIPLDGLQLNNPLTPRLDLLHPRLEAVNVQIRQAQITAVSLEGGRQDGELLELTGLLRVSEQGYRLVNAKGALLIHIRPGPQGNLAAHEGAVVTVRGPFHFGEPDYLLAWDVSRRFDVTLQGSAPDGELISEEYPAVTIGEDGSRPEALLWQVQFGPQASRLVRASQLFKGDALLLERGRSTWMFLNCEASRFDDAWFDQSSFAGGDCVETGVFNVSHFSLDTESGGTVFASSQPDEQPGVEVTLDWTSHQPGVFEVNLPADLPPRFGGRFDQARFANPSGAPEVFEGGVTEPTSDPDYIVARLEATSALVRADVVASLPLGYSAVPMPFRKPRYLKGGDEFNHARIYLTEEGINGFILIFAREPGPHGNQIHVAARKVSPARYDFTITFEGGRFEVARQIVLGPDLPALARDILQPNAVGILQAKAGGVRASVTRERTESRP